LNSNITSYNSKISVKIPPDISKIGVNETYILTSSLFNNLDLLSMQISAKTARKIAQNDE